MTNEKAIQLLHRISDSQFDGIHGDERREALSMAVMALEQNLVQESGGLVQDLVKDCISRQQAIDAVKDLPNCRNGFSDTYDKACIIGVLEDLPTAQPQRKKGTWIPVTNGRGGFECNQCHCYAPSYQDGVEWLSAFCPNCGCRMEGESE